MVELIQHKGLESEWKNHSLYWQLANIGSEVSRSLNNINEPARFQGAYERALELFDITIEYAAESETPARLGEICRAREEFCDYFDGNSWNTDPIKMQRYYDQFATIC